MQKEIHEQPESLVQTMRGRVAFARPPPGVDPYLAPPRIKLGGLAGGNADTIRRSRRIILVACGTSYHACLAARQTVRGCGGCCCVVAVVVVSCGCSAVVAAFKQKTHPQPITKTKNKHQKKVEEMVEVPVVLELASDMLDRRAPVFRDDTAVFVSQSGETADTLRALEYAKARGALCVGVTNTVGSAISRATHCGLHQNAGYEIGVASTKAYTSQILCVTMMALALGEDSVAKRARRDAIIDELGALPGKVRDALLLDGQMQELAASLKDAGSLLFFARGNNYATALEAALKAKEVALIHSEGILAGEMKHGPLALVDEHMPIVVVATR